MRGKNGERQEKARESRTGNREEQNKGQREYRKRGSDPDTEERERERTRESEYGEEWEETGGGDNIEQVRIHLLSPDSVSGRLAVIVSGCVLVRSREAPPSFVSPSDS